MISCSRSTRASDRVLPALSDVHHFSLQIEYRNVAIPHDF